MSVLKLNLKRIDPVKAGIIYGILMLLISLIVVVPMFLFMSAAGLSGREGALAMFGGGAAMVLILPIIYGIFGFLVGLIGTAIMNFVLSKTNGLDMEFKTENLELSQVKKEDVRF